MNDHPRVAFACMFLIQICSDPKFWKRKMEFFFIHLYCLIIFTTSRNSPIQVLHPTFGGTKLKFYVYFVMNKLIKLCECRYNKFVQFQCILQLSRKRHNKIKYPVTTSSVQGKDIVLRLIIEYNSLKGFWPLGTY
jgi:hypothetical protein